MQLGHGCAAEEYHDNEYGGLKTDDSSLFEKLCLESFRQGAFMAHGACEA